MDKSKKPAPFPFKDLKEMECGELEAECSSIEHEMLALQAELARNLLNKAEQKVMTELEGRMERARARFNSAKFALDKFKREHPKKNPQS